MNKKDLSETDIREKFILPSILKSGWDLQKQIRSEVTFTNGRIIVQGEKIKRGERKRVDYLLALKPNLPLAIVEAKDNRHKVGDGLQQALGYAKDLDVPFVFSSNGDSFVLHDRTGTYDNMEFEIGLDEFPSPSELWARYKKWKGISDEKEHIVSQDYYVEANSTKSPRYYQEQAINKSIEAIAKGQDRVLLVMATGTGKTYTAFQIIYRLWQSKTKKRILYLADRNILIDQTMNNDFKFFKSKGIMTKIKNRKVDTSYEIYMALYQGISGEDDWKNIYKEFSPDFFDLIIVDECHRGSAKENSAWREILEYFKSASQIGMTATPKETKDVSNIDYFGEPVYTYSLRQGIEDGFLAPYKVIRYSIDKDLEGWRPTKGFKDRYGHDVPDRIYNSKDFDRDLVLEARTELVAEKITELLKNSSRFSKTIVFCTDIDHAERMRRALVNLNRDLVEENDKYVVKITGDDEIGKAQLDPFIDPASKYPVIATTSKLMTTGVDAQTCKLIVLDSGINSMTEFKQIIGRGTRINEEYKKYYFTILDFKQVTNLFADPDFDGDPVQIYEPNTAEELVVTEIPTGKEYFSSEKDPTDMFDGTSEKPSKYYVGKDKVKVSVLRERVQYYGVDGKLITESLKDYTKKTVTNEFATMDDFLQSWKFADKKSAIISELINQGVLLHELKQEVGGDFDEFDLIAHVAFDQKPLTRKERANNVKKRDYFSKYGEKAREVINALLEKYADEGIENIEDFGVLRVNPLDKFGTPVEIIRAFGGKEQYLNAIKELEEQLYA